MDAVARGIEDVTTLLAVCGLAYYLMALWSARSFERSGKIKSEEAPPGVSILKPMKGLDPGIYAGLVSHCIQSYSGEYEIIFGVGSLQDPAVAAVHQLQQDFPQVKIRVVECPLRLGASGKVSNLAQMLPHATHRHLIVNDSDILVSPHYLANIMAGFRASASGRKVGLVTAPYIGHTGAASGSAGAGPSGSASRGWTWPSLAITASTPARDQAVRRVTRGVTTRRLPGLFGEPWVHVPIRVQSTIVASPDVSPERRAIRGIPILAPGRPILFISGAGCCPSRLPSRDT